MKNNHKNTKTQKILILLVMLMFFLTPFSAMGQIAPGSVLNLQDCIDIALKNHPDIKGAFHTVRIGDSRVSQAQSDYYPQIDSQSGYSRSRPYTRIDASPANNYSSSINLKQNIYDFGRRSARNQIAALNRDSFQEDMEEISSVIVMRVKQAYYNVLQALENTAVAKKSVDQFQNHLEMVRAFFEVGLKPKFDVTKAEVDLSNAKLDLIKAENVLRIAKATLNNAMGMPGAADYHLENDLFPQDGEIDLSLETSLNRAYENRHDLKSILLRQEAAQKNLSLNRSGHYPTITGNASYGYGGSNFPLSDGWSFGGALNIPLFSGFLTQSQILEAKENIGVIGAQIESVKQNIRLEVEQALSNLREAINRIETTGIIVRQAEENKDLAEGRYRSGVGTPIEVTDAFLALSRAQISRIAALADFKIGQAALEKAMGIK